MTSNKSLIRKAKEFYFYEWKGHEKICPAFKDKVFATRLGWNHVVYNRRHKTKDVVMRLKYLRLAKELLETATLYQDFRKRGNDCFYAFDAIFKGKRVRIIVTSRGEVGRKLFLSLIYRPKK